MSRLAASLRVQGALQDSRRRVGHPKPLEMGKAHPGTCQLETETAFQVSILVLQARTFLFSLLRTLQGMAVFVPPSSQTILTSQRPQSKGKGQ